MRKPPSAARVTLSWRRKPQSLARMLLWESREVGLLDDIATRASLSLIYGATDISISTIVSTYLEEENLSSVSEERMSTMSGRLVELIHWREDVYYDR